MAAADKARYYLERTVPDLQELAKKEIFSAEEIASIVKKRSDFEHILNGPGSKPNDYVRYAAYELNLDNLRRKRCGRLGVKSTAYSGRRTVFFILERATNKFPGDRALWAQYIQFCQQEKANKKLARAYTSVLRLRPRDWRMWISAAKHYAETQGDMPTARGYLQRGIRFCADEKQLYLQYAKLEMVYLAKLAARRRLLGLSGAKAEEQQEDESTIALPTTMTEDLMPEDTKGLEHVDNNMLERLEKAPILQGAVPVAIFDSAMKQFHNSPDLCEQYFDICSEFEGVEAIDKMQKHILRHLESTGSDSAAIVACEMKQSLKGIDSRSADFPAALGTSLAFVREGQARLSDPQKQRLSEKVIQILLPYLLEEDELDDALLQVLRSTLRSHAKRLDQDLNKLIKQLEKEGRDDAASALIAIA